MRAFFSLIVALVLAGCYDTEQRVLERGQDVGLPAGTYRCVNTNDKEPATIVLSGPTAAGRDDFTYRAVVDRSTYALRMEKSRDLIIIEADEAGKISHVFLRRESDGAYALLVPDKRDLLQALALRYGVTLTFDRVGPPKPRGTPEKLRAFLRDHTGPELRQTSTCRKT